MKTLIWVCVLLCLTRAAFAVGFHPVVVSNLAEVPERRLKDSLGNTYSFNFDSVTRTSVQGQSDVIYGSRNIISYPTLSGGYHFTSVAVGADDTLYIVASGISSSSVGAVLVAGKPGSDFSRLDLRIVSFDPDSDAEVGVDDHGNVFGIGPNGSILKITPPTINSSGSYTELVPNYVFRSPDGDSVPPQDLRVSRDGRIFVEGYLPPYTSPRWLEIVPGPAAPTIIQQPRSVDLSPGETATLTVEVFSEIPVNYQWLRYQIPIPGATGPTLVTAQSGAYRVIANNATGLIASDNAFVRPAGLINVSSRAAVGAAGDLAIAGFIIAGESGSPRTVLVRAVGPGLSDFGIKDFLRKPELSVYDASGKLIASNNGWANASSVSLATETAHAFPFKNDSADAALVLDLQPGAYTAQVRGAGGSTGVALVEVYEAGGAVNRFINVSTRAKVETGAGILIGGIIPGGDQPMPILVRAIGPGLKAYGITNALAHPVLSVYDGSGKLVAVNEGWSSGGSDQAVAVADATARAKAFTLTPGSADCALALNLAPGAYTLQVSGRDQETGVALVEAYQVPADSATVSAELAK